MDRTHRHTAYWTRECHGNGTIVLYNIVYLNSDDTSIGTGFSPDRRPTARSTLLFGNSRNCFSSSCIRLLLVADSWKRICSSFMRTGCFQAQKWRRISPRTHWRDPVRIPYKLPTPHPPSIFWILRDPTLVRGVGTDLSRDVMVQHPEIPTHLGLSSSRWVLETLVVRFRAIDSAQLTSLHFAIFSTCLEHLIFVVGL